MTEEAVQIVARGPRAQAEAAALAIDADPRLEGVTYSILEEDEDHDIWRIDAFPTTAPAYTNPATQANLVSIREADIKADIPHLEVVTFEGKHTIDQTTLLSITSL